MPINAGGWRSAMLVLVAVVLLVAAACLPEGRGLLVAWLSAVACTWRSSPDGRS